LSSRLARPLLGEDDLVVVVTEIEQIAGIGEVEGLLARWLSSLALDVWQEIGPVKVDLVACPSFGGGG